MASDSEVAREVLRLRLYLEDITRMKSIDLAVGMASRALGGAPHPSGIERSVDEPARPGVAPRLGASLSAPPHSEGFDRAALHHMTGPRASRSRSL